MQRRCAAWMTFFRNSILGQQQSPQLLTSAELPTKPNFWLHEVALQDKQLWTCIEDAKAGTARQLKREPNLLSHLRLWLELILACEGTSIVVSTLLVGVA